MNASQAFDAGEEIANVLNMTESAKTISTIRSPYYYHYTISDDFYFYGVSVIIPFGLIGNFFSICIFLLSPILRRTTTGQYLVALAIADSTFLVGEILRWLCYFRVLSSEYYLSPSLGLHIYETSYAVCRMTFFLRYGAGLWSVWITTAIAVERLLAVAFPLKIGRISTLRTSRAVIIIIAIISFSLALFSFWVFDIIVNDDTPQCKISDMEGYNIWNTVVIKFGTLIIPGVIIAIVTIIIIVLLHRARNQRVSQLAASVRGPRKGRPNFGFSMETQLTIMLVAVCVASTALRAPYTIAYYFRSQCWDPNPCDSLTAMQTYVANRIADVFSITNYAINFFLYCLSGSSFREQIKKTCCRGTRGRNSHYTQEINLETLSTPQLGSKNRSLKHTSRASPSVEANNI